MIIITAIDDNKGMMFNKRRQTQDRNMREYILKIVKNESLWMNVYSYGLFLNHKNANIKVSDKCLELVKENEYCFVENIDIKKYENKIEKLILFRWNCKYPSDFKLNLDLEQWRLIAKEDFKGTSHEKITEEEYIK